MLLVIIKLIAGRAVGRLLSPTYDLDPNWDKIKRAIIAAESIEAAQENRRSKKNPVSTVSSKSKPATASLEEDCKIEKVSILADEVVTHLCFLPYYVSNTYTIYCMFGSCKGSSKNSIEE